MYDAAIGGQPAALLLHSSASSGRQWERLIEEMKPHVRAHAVDLHGHGERAGWRGAAPLTLADEAALAVPLLMQTGGAHIIGHSYGGAVALKLATLYPKWVRSVVVYEPVLFPWLTKDPMSHNLVQEVAAVAASIQDHLRGGDAHSAARRFINFWSGDGSWESLPAGKQSSIAPRMQAVSHHFDALFSDTLQRTELAPLTMPMMFVSGSRTVAVTRRIAGLLRAALPDAEHELLQAMGHMGPITHASDFNRRVMQFLHAHEESNSAVEELSELV